MTHTQTLIAETCDEIKELLLDKNRKYGDSAVNPIRILSKSSNTEQILVRIDDKLNRIKNAQSDEDEDPEGRPEPAPKKKSGLNEFKSRVFSSKKK